MDKPNLNSLNPIKFTELIKSREMAIASASTEPPLAENGANKLAKELHPYRQHLTVCEISECSGAKTYYLKPNDELGTKRCAYFSAGQYLTVYVEINNTVYSRPYSISSSPKEALEGYYSLTVKSVSGGIVSNYILDNWELGTSVTVSDPIGNFTYEPLRDAKHIVGIAGGSGITPFISLAKAIADGDEECSLTLIYGNRKESDILFQSELNMLAEKNDKIKVVHVLSDEQKENYENGYITAELIKKYAPSEPYSVFICGPKQMTAFVDNELAKLDLEQKYIRHEVHGEMLEPTELSGYLGCDKNIINITVNLHSKKIRISGKANQTILRILENGEINPPSRCRSGECGFCHSKLISGEVYIPKEFDKRRQADEKYGYIHPCCSYPLSDLEIEISSS